jgi:hypothetical protein
MVLATRKSMTVMVPLMEKERSSLRSPPRALRAAAVEEKLDSLRTLLSIEYPWMLTCAGREIHILHLER